MISYVLFSLGVSFFFMMPFMLHPLSLGLCIMFCSLVSCLLIGVVSHAWFGFILFLVFVGGLLVMFAYVSALSPNVYFSGMGLFIGGIMMWVLSFFFFFSVWFSDTIVVKDLLLNEFELSESSMGEKFTIPSRISIMVGLGIILLLNLLAVVKICYYQQGPLRQHFL
nr:TPA_asm: NADH dehydrogenase subunit 6 [Pachydermia laevis]